ncbi:hypothetical protein TNCV_240571 [Trichonephila clavipes]|nr:hypothetical protein TNCV_240571 [Trichonephila clavipes]
MRCHTEETCSHSDRTVAVYDECISSNDVFKKCVASAICASVWRRSFRIHSDTNATFPTYHEVSRQTGSTSSVDCRPALFKMVRSFVNLRSRNGNVIFLTSHSKANYLQKITAARDVWSHGIDSTDMAM